MKKYNFISACVFSVVATVLSFGAHAQGYNYHYGGSGASNYNNYRNHNDRHRHYREERLYEYRPAPVWRNQYTLPPPVYVNPVPVYVPSPVYVPAPVYYNPYYGNGYYRPGYGARVDYGYSNRDVAGMAMGGLIGGAIGHEIGGRDGRAAGAIIGAIIGSQ